MLQLLQQQRLRDLAVAHVKRPNTDHQPVMREADRAAAQSIRCGLSLFRRDRGRLCPSTALLLLPVLPAWLLENGSDDGGDMFALLPLPGVLAAANRPTSASVASDEGETGDSCKPCAISARASVS